MSNCIRNYRLNFSRKSSRIFNIADIVHRLTVSSDPFLDQFRVPIKAPIAQKYLPEVVNLFLQDSDSPMDVDDLE